MTTATALWIFFTVVNLSVAAVAWGMYRASCHIEINTDPGREAEEYDTQPAPGFACGRGLGRRKES